MGDSKFGAMLKVNNPDWLLMEKKPASVPPVIEKVSVSPGRSASDAVAVATAVVFSATLIDADAPPPLLVMTGVIV